MIFTISQPPTSKGVHCHRVSLHSTSSPSMSVFFGCFAQHNPPRRSLLRILPVLCRLVYVYCLLLRSTSVLGRGWLPNLVFFTLASSPLTRTLQGYLGRWRRTTVLVRVPSSDIKTTIHCEDTSLSAMPTHPPIDNWLVNRHATYGRNGQMKKHIIHFSSRVGCKNTDATE